MTSARALPVEWQKSSYSTNGGNCVEYSTSLLDAGSVPVRDSKDANSPALMFTPETWASFVGGVCRAEIPTD